MYIGTRKYEIYIGVERENFELEVSHFLLLCTEMYHQHLFCVSQEVIEYPKTKFMSHPSWTNFIRPFQTFKIQCILYVFKCTASIPCTSEIAK